MKDLFDKITQFLFSLAVVACVVYLLKGIAIGLLAVFPVVSPILIAIGTCILYAFISDFIKR